MRRMATRIGAVTSATMLSVALFAPTTAVAELEGEFAAQADGSQLFVDAVNFNALTAEPPVNSVATIGVAPTQAQVANPDGLGGGVISRGFGQNLDLSVFDNEVPLDLSTAEQTAPPDNAEPMVTTLIPLDEAAPLLTGAVSESTAWARDPAAIECPDEGRAVISQGTSTTTDLGILEIDEEAGTTLVSVRDPQDGTLTSTSGTYVGSEGQIIAESSAQTAAANIAGELVVEAVNPVLTATASGNPGGATVEYTGEVRVNGEKIAGVQENTLSLDALVDVLTPLDEQALNQLTGPLDEGTSEVLTPLTEQLPIFDEQGYTGETLTNLIQNEVIDLDELAFLNPTVRVTAGELENVQESADGTRASGEVKTVRVELNIVSTLTETEVPILTFHLMPLAVDAQAPAGGLDCGGTPEDRDPFENLRKEASTAVVAPGDTFEYEITVPNDDPTCTVTDVSVTDVVSGPTGFTITGASDDGSIDGDTVTWDLDDLAPGEEHTVTLTVQVPNTAQDGDTFDDEVTATGECDGQPVSGDFLLPDIPRVATGDVDVNLPRTGGGMALLGLGALAAAGRLRRRG